MNNMMTVSINASKASNLRVCRSVVESLSEILCKKILLLPILYHNCKLGRIRQKNYFIAFD